MTTQVVKLELELNSFKNKYLKQSGTAAPDSLIHAFCSKVVDFSTQALTDLNSENNHIFELHKNSKLLKIYDQLFNVIKEKKDYNVNSDSIKNILPIIFENIEKTADLLTHSETSKNYNEKNLFTKAGALVYQSIIQQFKEIESTSLNSSNNENTTKRESLTHAANLYEEAASLNDDPTKQRNLQRKANLYLHGAAALEEAEYFLKNEPKNYSDIFSKMSDSLLSLAKNYDDNIQDDTKIVKAQKELRSIEMQYREAANNIKESTNSDSDTAKIIVALKQADSMDSLFEKTTNSDNIGKKQHDSQLENKLSQLSNSDTGEESSSNPTDEQQKYSELADAISNISSNLAENLTKKSGLFSAGPFNGEVQHVKKNRKAT
jgi:hypothetical protein